MWYIRISVLVLLLTPVYAQKNLNLATLKRDTEIFEGIVQKVLKQNFKDPFVITAEPKGAYLQGYGVIFSFQLNISRNKIRTPFGEIDMPPKVVDLSKDEQIRLVKVSMIQCLADYGSSIKQLGGTDRVTISAHIDDRNELDPAKNTTVLVFTASRDDIELYTLKRISLDKFKDRVLVLQY